MANSIKNPFKGKLFNKPTEKGTPGEDVYEGCKIHYKGLHANAHNFYKVMLGEENGGKPVLKSDENSKIFFYFADHGAPGLLAMPVTPFNIGYIYADKLNKTIKQMKEKKMFKEMTMYVEACESGSMFQDKLSSDLGVYAVSAANATQSSWGTYCGSDAKVDGKNIGSCLGDLFSVNWMEDSDAALMDTETLQEQYETVRRETTKSQVLQWGDLSFTSEPLSAFEGTLEKASNHEKLSSKDLVNSIKGLLAGNKEHNLKNIGAVDARDAELSYLFHAYREEPSAENKSALQEHIEHRETVHKIFSEVFGEKMSEGILAGEPSPLPTDFDCYRSMIAAYEKNCFNHDEYSLRYFKAFVHQCEAMANFPEGAQLIETSLNKIEEVCKNII